MGFYSTRILPALLDMATSGAGTESLRREALAAARGRVLDVGFGTGGNVPFFPPDVVSVVGLDPNPGVEKRAQRRIRAATIPIELRIGAGERLPFPDASFDTVVTTLVLCSVGDPAATLKEIRRVLAPGGRYLLLEHGLGEHEQGHQAEGQQRLHQRDRRARQREDLERRTKHRQRRARKPAPARRQPQQKRKAQRLLARRQPHLERLHHVAALVTGGGEHGCDQTERHQ